MKARNTPTGGMMAGKTAVVMGIANKRSIAWGITQALAREGARIVLGYLNERVGKNVRKLAESLPDDTILAPCDVTKPEEIEEFFVDLAISIEGIDALVHSLAFAKGEDLVGRFEDTSLDGFQLAQHISTYSLIALTRAARPLMRKRNASVIALSFMGSERVVTGYNVMGVAKAALEATVRYLAAGLGPEGTRVNAISAGPVKTLSAMAVPGISDMLTFIKQKAPLRHTTRIEEVGNTAAFLLSDMSSGITGQVIHVDSGFSIMGS